MLILNWILLSILSYLYTQPFKGYCRVDLCWPTLPVKNWTILLEQSFTAHIPLPMAYIQGENAKLVAGVTKGQCQCSMAVNTHTSVLQPSEVCLGLSW